MNALAPMAGPPVAFPRQAETDDQLIRLWLHGRSANTQRAYSTDAERFRAFVRKSLAQVTVGDLQAFGDSLNALSDASRARLLSSVKSLLTYGHRIGYLPFNVGAPVRLPRIKDTIAERILPEETVLKMIAFETSPRNKAVIRLLYSAGLRVSELSGLDWKDFQERDEAAQVTVFGKGGKTRHILLTVGTWAALCSIRNDAGGDDPVFVSRKGSRLSTCQALRIVRKAAKRAGVDLMVSPHWLRHCHGSHALDRGAAVHLVQATLGHASVATTGRYLHARPTESSSKYLAV
jgi:integrase/recombinase XerD